MNFYTEKQLNQARVSNFQDAEGLAKTWPLKPSLLYFMAELEFKNPRFKFGIENKKYKLIMDNPIESKDPSGPHVISRVSVYVEGETFRRGWIGRNNFNNTNGETKYGVWSPSITNEKYSPSAYQYNLKASKTCSIAVKSAMAFLDKVTTKEVHMAYAYRVENKIDSEANSFKTAIRERMDELGLQSSYGSNSKVDDLVGELLALYEGGHQFINPEITNRLKAVKDAVTERTDHVVNKQAVLVWVDGSTARTAEINFNQQTRNDLTNEKAWGSPNDMPIDILNKVSILQVAEKGDYVPDTGVQMADDIFYVQV